eukprot:15364947-Ditylum_brightwellii.AAC.1
MKHFYRCNGKKIKKEKESAENHDFTYNAVFNPPSGVCTCLTRKKAPKQMISHGFMLLILESKKDQKR